MCDYDKDKASSYLMYLDANNLYGWAMSQPLPIGRFKWSKEDNRMVYLKIKILLNVIWNIQRNYIIYIMITPLSLKN